MHFIKIIYLASILFYAIPISIFAQSKSDENPKKITLFDKLNRQSAMMNPWVIENFDFLIEVLAECDEFDLLEFQEEELLLISEKYREKMNEINSQFPGDLKKQRGLKIQFGRTVIKELLEKGILLDEQIEIMNGLNLSRNGLTRIVLNPAMRSKLDLTDSQLKSIKNSNESLKTKLLDTVRSLKKQHLNVVWNQLDDSQKKTIKDLYGASQIEKYYRLIDFNMMLRDVGAQRSEVNLKLELEKQ